MLSVFDFSLVVQKDYRLNVPGDNENDVIRNKGGYDVPGKRSGGMTFRGIDLASYTVPLLHPIQRAEEPHLHLCINDTYPFHCHHQEDSYNNIHFSNY